MSNNNDMQSFLKFLQEGLNSWEKAGKVLVVMLRHNPDVKNQIVRDHPHISLGVLNALEQVGMGVLHPKLLLSECPAFVAARKLPLSDQERCLNAPLPFVVVGPAGPDVLMVEAQSLTKKQTRQLFAPDHIRPENEQRVWLESQKKNDFGRRRQAYEVRDGKVYFNTNCGFTAQQLSMILGEIASSHAA